MPEDPLQHFLRENTYQETPLSKAEEDLLMGKFKSKYVDLYANEQPELESFEDKIDTEIISRDLKYVEERERLIKKEKHDRAILAESLLYYLINKRQLLGTDIEAFAASRYDDIASGVDMVLEIHDGKEPHWIAVDVTVAENPEIVNEKKQKTIDKLAKGRLTTVKYFNNEAGIKGSISIPKVIFPISREELRAISEMLVYQKSGDLITRKLQERLMHEAKVQLTEGRGLLAKVKDRELSEKLVKKYEATLQSISPNS